MHDLRAITTSGLFIVVLACTMLPLDCGHISTARAQILELPRADSSRGDFFGTSVAISGRRILVGATGEDACGTNSGAAYVYEQTDDGWARAAYLMPSDCEAGRLFGRSVALSGDVAVVAASQEFFSRETPNIVYVFEPDSAGTWHETGKLSGGSASEEGPFGTSVSVHDEQILVTTAGNSTQGTRRNRSGAAYVFSRSADGAWVKSDRFTSASTRFGIFGTSGAIHGSHAVVSASTYFQHRPGSVYFFALDDESSRWEQTSRFGGIDDFFISVDMSERRAIVGESKAGSSETGAATIFDLDESGEWVESQSIRLGRPYDHGAFGTDVAIDGDYALIAAYDEQLGLDINVDRVVYVFKRSASGAWKQHQVIDVGEVAFGASLDVDGGYAVIGSAADDEPGAVYVVQLVE